MKNEIINILIFHLCRYLCKSVAVYFLWNWLIPDLFLCGCDVSFLQSLGMVFMFDILTFHGDRNSI